MASFPSKPKLSAILQQATLKRDGLVADCIFPPVKTPCNFEYIDWSNGINVKAVDDAVACKSDVHEVDPESFVLTPAKVQDHALVQSMGDCCVTTCGDDAGYAAKIEQGKTIQLMNRLLIGREKRAVALATNEASYINNNALVPGEVGAVNEGGMYSLTKASLNDANFALLKYFQPIQTNNFTTGRRTKAVMSQNTLNAFLSHPNFLGAGCIINPLTTKDAVAALLGVNEVCIGDAALNNGVGAAVSLAGNWSDNYILFTASYELLTVNEQQVGFGFSAYDKGFRINYYTNEAKGPDGGVQMQKMAHDWTEIVLTYRAATLVKLT